MIEEGPFRAGSAGNVSLLRERLRAAGFEEGVVSRILQGRSDRNLDAAYVIHRTREASPLHALVRLFILRMPLHVNTAASILSPAGLECALECGLVEMAGDEIHAVACLRPWRNFFLLSDFLPREGESLPPDFVMSGTSASSISLTRLTLRGAVRTALDLGTGAGIHALLAAAHAEHVLATDTNPRALNFAAMNARLNGIDNVSFLQGSLFEPVAGETFDLIVSNPPFVISPPSSLMFRDTGLQGDNVSEVLLRQSPAQLRERGCVITLVSWHHESTEDWPLRPCAWVQGSGCDLWLLHCTSEEPLDYAAHSLRQSERIGSSAYAERLDDWMKYYQEQGFARLALGAAILRKRPAPKNWIHSEELAGAAVASDAAEQIERVFAAEDFLAELQDDRELLDTRVRLHPDHVLEQELVAGDDGWMSRSLVLKPAHGIEHRAAIDSTVLMLLARCNGTRTVRDLVSSIVENDEADVEAVVAGGLALVRRLLRAGLLVCES